MQLFLINIVICSWTSGKLTGPWSDIVFFSQATGEDFNVEEGKGKQPSRALLDVGLVRTTTGNRVFGALKVLFRLRFWDVLHVAPYHGHYLSSCSELYPATDVL